MINILGLICLNLSKTESYPKSGEQDDQIAPKELTAKKAQLDSILFGT